MCKSVECEEKVVEGGVGLLLGLSLGCARGSILCFYVCRCFRCRGVVVWVDGVVESVRVG